MLKILNSKRLGFGIWDLEFCLGFRISDLEFEGQDFRLRFLNNGKNHSD